MYVELKKEKEKPVAKSPDSFREFVTKLYQNGVYFEAMLMSVTDESDTNIVKEVVEAKENQEKFQNAK